MQKKYVVREEARVDRGKEGGVGQGERVFGRGGAGEAVGYWQDDLHTNIALQYMKKDPLYVLLLPPALDTG